MKKVLLIILISLLVVRVYLSKILSSKVDNQINLQKKIQKTISPYEEFTIDAMRKRSYDGGIIETIEKAYSTSTFNAYIVIYKSDGLKLRALMSIPKTKKPEKGYPVLVLNHGYIDPKQYSTVSSYRKIFDFFAAQGFIVLKPDYRANDKSEGDPQNQLNRLAYAIDVLNLVSSVSTIKDPSINSGQVANPEKIVMWGHSLGGDVTLRVLEVSDKIKGASLWGPVSADYPESMLYFVRKNQPQELKKVEEFMTKLLPREYYDKLSPSKHLDLIHAPLVIHHGDADESVPVVWTDALAKRLEKNHKNFTLYNYPRENHNFTKDSRSTVLERDITFFNSIVK